MTCMYEEGIISFCEVPKMLKEAISKLKKVLEADQDDHEAIFELVVVYCRHTMFDIYLRVERSNFCYKKALECFEKVGDKSSEMDEMDEEEKPNKYVEPIRRVYMNERDCKTAKIRNAINPNDVHNLRRWGIALAELSSNHMPYINGADLLEEAIDKFKRALFLEPDDINTKLQLAKARLSNCSCLDGEEPKKLLEECYQLDAEVEVLSKASRMVLNEMGQVAAVSEKSSRCIVQSQTSINLRSPKEIELHHKNKYNHGIFPVEWPMRSGASRLGIPAAAMQMRGLRTGGIRSRGLAGPVLQVLLQQLISPK